MIFIYILWLQYVGSDIGKFHFHWNYYNENGKKVQRNKEHLQQERFERATRDRNCFLIDYNIQLNCQAFNTCCPEKGHIYLNKAAGLFTHVTILWTPGVKGLKQY